MPSNTSTPGRRSTISLGSAVGTVLLLGLVKTRGGLPGTTKEEKESNEKERDVEAELLLARDETKDSKLAHENEARERRVAEYMSTSL